VLGPGAWCGRVDREMISERLSDDSPILVIDHVTVRRAVAAILRSAAVHQAGLRHSCGDDPREP
jgi:hypothetical protein